MKERIKDILDQECKDSGQACECYDLTNQDANGVYHGAKACCSVCRKHNALAARIAEIKE